MLRSAPLSRKAGSLLDPKIGPGRWTYQHHRPDRPGAKKEITMQLMRRQETWDPFREMEDLSNRMDRLIGLTRWPGNGQRELLATSDWSPSCDISETETEYRIHAELPNVKKEDVKVTLEDSVLTLQGDRREEKEQKGEMFHRRELSYGHFLRRFTMPPDADETKVDATFKDGMLNVVIARSKAKAPKAKEIAVH
jgi:HSP20 family protein